MTVGGSARPRARAADGRCVTGWVRRNWGPALWALFNAAIAVLAAVLAVTRPMETAVGPYAAAALDWWAGRPVPAADVPLLPSANLMFGPLALLPLGIADQVWRLLSVAALTWAVYRAADLVRPDAPGPVAFRVLALAIPAAATGVMRGDWDVMTTAVLLHAAVDLAWDRRARGGLLLALSAVAQPTALVPALLFGAVRPRVLPWLLAGLAAVLAVPFLHPAPAYVAGQYAALLDRLDLAPPYTAMTAVRVGGALCTLGAAFLAYRRLDGRTAALVTLMLAVAYTVLADPRTGDGSFLGIAVLAGMALFAERRRRPAAVLPVLLGALAVGLGVHVYGDWIGIGEAVQGWLKPALTLLLYAYAVAVVAWPRTLVDPDPEPARRCDWRPDRVALVLCAVVPPLYAGSRLLTQAPLRQWLSSFEVLDYLILVVALNLIGVALVVATGPLWNWMRGRPLRPNAEE